MTRDEQRKAEARADFLVVAAVLSFYVWLVLGGLCLLWATVW